MASGVGGKLSTTDGKMRAGGGGTVVGGCVQDRSTFCRDGGRDWGRNSRYAPPVEASCPGGRLEFPPHLRVKNVQWGESDGNTVGRPISMTQWCTVHLQLILLLVHPGGARHGWASPLLSRQVGHDPGRYPFCYWLRHKDPLAHLWAPHFPHPHHAVVVRRWRWCRG